MVATLAQCADSALDCEIAHFIGAGGSFTLAIEVETVDIGDDVGGMQTVAKNGNRIESVLRLVGGQGVWRGKHEGRLLLSPVISDLTVRRLNLNAIP
jgi:flavin reductase (DIM6/NTAB) family NADH-FMN oxidoreductase RutF